jgi:hypothetical protein
MLGHQATEEKSNEITAIPLLLKHLDLKDALVTMDAMGTQTDIARAIRDGGGVVSPLTLKLAGRHARNRQRGALVTPRKRLIQGNTLDFVLCRAY